VRIASRNADCVVLESVAQPLSTVLGSGTIYAYAAQDADHRVLAGRGPAYAIHLAGVPAVVRHARHGGLLASLTRDVFIRPTRAPYELSVSIQLRANGVQTPEVIAYAIYPAGPGLSRADVVTREIVSGRDLLSCLGPGGPREVNRTAVWNAVHALIAALGRVGAFHADLNVKNVLITGADTDQPVAHALDVDRVIWRRAGDPGVVRANTARLLRSAEKRGLV
jgi:3-deoxy-D-manno-octulosonic acid kinase